MSDGVVWWELECVDCGHRWQEDTPADSDPDEQGMDCPACGEILLDFKRA